MQATRKERLTATEMGLLWTTYINDSMTHCLVSYFLAKAEDPAIKPAFALALHIIEKQIHALTTIFKSDHFPLPVGFTEKDVDVKAPRLFSDGFALQYVKDMANVGLPMSALAYSSSSRLDVRAFYYDSIDDIRRLDENSTEVLKSMGLYVMSPFITIPEKVSFVRKQHFLSGGGFFGYGEKRPMIAMEIANLSSNIMTNALGKALMMGFSQVARSTEIRDYLLRGKDISGKHIKIFSDLLVEEDLPAPTSWDSDVTDSTMPPFSDKLMLFHVALLVTAGTSNYATAASASPRSDIATTYVRLAAEIASYAKDGAKLTIDKGWLEEPPHAVDRKELVKA